MKFFFTVFSFLFVLSTRSGHAQVTSMSLMGSVLTDDRKPLPGAAVTVIHLPSGVRHAVASDGAGRFVIPNLMMGGPYVMQVGQGGYQPQTLESIFLENGKITAFTFTLSKLAVSPPKGRPGRAAEKTATTAEVLAPEGKMGGSVLLTASTSASAGRPSAPKSRNQAVPESAPANQSVPASPASPPPAAGSVARAAPTPAAGPRRYYRYPSDRYAARRPGTSPKVADIIVPGRYDAKSGNYIYDTGQPTTLKLANGSVIAGVGTNSTESFLYRFITTPQMQVDTLDLTKGWYNFDRVYFDAGKATLTTESISQLRNLAALLRAYPQARVKLGGYTDSTGTYKVNKMLSEARARTAWASLVEMGISPTRIEARGYGPRYNISPNTTEEGRAKNRRLSVKVLQK